MFLSQIQIEISDTEWEKLNKDVWSENYVDGYLVVGEINEPIKLRYRGGHTREYPKKSFEILHGLKTIHLNAEYDDPSAIRNALSFQFFNWIGVPSPRTQHCLLTMNGKNLGVYLEIEGVNNYFFEQRNISFESLIYGVNNGADFSLLNSFTKERKQSLFNGYELIIGNDSDRQNLESFIYKINTLKNNELTQYLEIHLDIENYLRWLAGAVFTGNYDGFNQNYAIYLYKQRRLYRIVPWDYEGTWGRNCYGKRVGSNLVSVMGYNVLTKKLLSRKQNRRKYSEILSEILETSFTVDRLGHEIGRMFEKIYPYIHADISRKYPFSVFEQEASIIMSYIQERRKIILNGITKLKSRC